MSSAKRDKLDNPLLNDEPAVLYVENSSGQIKSSQQSQQYGGSNGQQGSSKKYLWSGLSFCFCFLLFLLLFFLIPRVPVISYVSTVAQFDRLPMTVTQTYSVKNPNYYSITLTDFNQLQIQSPMYSVKVTGPGGSVVTYTFQYTAVGSGPTLVVPSQSTANFNLFYNTTSEASDLTVMSAECFSTDGVTLYTTGNFQSKTSAGQKYTLPFKSTAIVYCS